VEPLDADLAAPGPLRRLLDGRDEAVHVVAAVAVVAEEQLVVVLAGAAEGAALALDALPRVLLHADDHVLRELQARGVARSSALRAGDEFLRQSRLLVLGGVAEAKVAIAEGGRALLARHGLGDVRVQRVAETAAAAAAACAARCCSAAERRQSGRRCRECASFAPRSSCGCRRWRSRRTPCSCPCS